MPPRHLRHAGLGCSRLRATRRVGQTRGSKPGSRSAFYPHGLRHSLAFDMAMTGEPTHQIQAALGHSSLAITDRYVRYIAPADVVATMRSREW